EPVVDISVERVQRHPPLGDGLLTAHLYAAEPPGALYAHALCSTAHRARERPLHRPAEGGPPLELLGYRLGDQVGVELRPGDLPHVDLHPLAGEALELGPQGIHLAAALA